MQRLHGVAQAALDGQLEPAVLRGLPAEEALEHLQRLSGIGSMYATLILLRSTGTADMMTFNEPRLPAYIAHFYELGQSLATREEIEEVSDHWRPFRTWASVLIRVAGDRASIPVPVHP
jgi:DNA-3-methyladenine glycosylase II